jgi:organic radical activating enzyme
MDEISAELPFLSNIGLMLTYKCTLGCPHCIVEAGPNRKEEMPEEMALHCVGQARAYAGGRVKGLALTGGEPFCNLALLGRVSSYALRQGLIVSVVTNAFWAPTRDAALDVLTRLPALRVICISTDVYHQRFVPFEYARNAAWAAKELGRLHNFALCTDDENDPHFRKIVDDLTAMGDGDKLRIAITFPLGRAGKQAGEFKYQWAFEPPVSACTMAACPVIFPDGRVIACIGSVLTLRHPHPLALGNVTHEPLSEILDRAEMNAILHVIRVWGPHKLIALLKDRGFSSLVPKTFVRDSLCDACYKVVSNPQAVEALNGILQEPEFQKLLAYARLHYLKEPIMVERHAFAGIS